METLRRLGLTMLLFVALSVIALWLHYHINYHDAAVMFGAGFWMGWWMALAVNLVWRKRPFSAF